MGLIQNKCQPRQLAAVNAYIRTLPSLQGWSLPSNGLDMSRKATATELANLFKVLPVALLAVPSLFATFGEVMQGETCRVLSWQTFQI